jgi:hypothetical protein
MSDLTYKTTVRPPERKMEEFLGKVRKARELVRGAGGTTKLTKNGDSLELTISAPASIVVATVDAIQRLCASTWSVEAGITSFFERAEKDRDSRKRDFLEEVLGQMRKNES